jgi:hypothetical protein
MERSLSRPRITIRVQHYPMCLVSQAVHSGRLGPPMLPYGRPRGRRRGLPRSKKAILREGQAAQADAWPFWYKDGSQGLFESSTTFGVTILVAHAGA